MKLSGLWLILAVLFLASPRVHAQQRNTVNGMVTDSSGQPLPGATISLLDQQLRVVQYVFSRSNGYFSFSTRITTGWLEVSFLGYKKHRVQWSPTTKSLLFRLHPEPDLLKEVVVKPRPSATLQGDTLMYLVRQFADKEDRSIGDVLRRLPGMELGQDGTIYFNGKKIDNLFIDGDDLMDGRYGLATRVIRKDLIRRVDIIQHHQPIVVLKDKVFTDKIAVNLVLQDENSLKLSAMAQVGVGFPAMAEVSVAPILLNKTFKSVNRAALNNAGTDYRNDLKQLGNMNYPDESNSQSRPLDLNLASNQPPDVPQQYYYLNKSALLQFNNMIRNKKGIQFKLNVNGYWDRNELDYGANTVSYLVNDTIRYRESQRTIHRPFWWNAGFHLQSNKATHFFNNSFRISLQKDRSTGQMDFNGHRFDQHLQQSKLEFSNDFNWMPAIRSRGIAEFRWLMGYGLNRQDLQLGDGYYFDVTPQQGYYDAVVQQIHSPSWQHHAYLSYKIPAGSFTQEYRLGYQSLPQSLQSRLELEQNGEILPYLNDPGNDLQWRNNSWYASAQYQLKFQKFRSEVRLPLYYRQLHSTQPDYQSVVQKRRLLFLPMLRFSVHFDNEKYLQASYEMQNDFGEMNQSYQGAILLNYRSLQSYSQAMQQQRLHRSSLVYYFQKSIKLFFSNLGISFDHKRAGLLLSDSFSNNIRQTVFLPYPNDQVTVSVHAGLSQYIFPLKTKADLKLQKQRAFQEQLVNGSLLRYQFDDFSVNTGLNKKLGRSVDLYHQSSISWGRMGLAEPEKQETSPRTRLFGFQQQFRASTRFLKSFLVEATARHRINRFTGFTGNGYFFLDAAIKRSGWIKGLDLELNVYNLFHERDYTIFYQSGNQSLTSQYPLRGRTFFLRLSYAL